MNSAIRFSVFTQMQDFWKRQLNDSNAPIGTVKSFGSGAVAGTIATRKLLCLSLFVQVRYS